MMKNSSTVFLILSISAVFTAVQGDGTQGRHFPSSGTNHRRQHTDRKLKFIGQNKAPKNGIAEVAKIADLSFSDLNAQIRTIEQGLEQTQDHNEAMVDPKPEAMVDPTVSVGDQEEEEEEPVAIEPSVSPTLLPFSEIEERAGGGIPEGSEPDKQEPADTRKGDTHKGTPPPPPHDRTSSISNREDRTSREATRTNTMNRLDSTNRDELRRPVRDIAAHTTETGSRKSSNNSSNANKKGGENKPAKGNRRTRRAPRNLQKQAKNSKTAVLDLVEEEFGQEVHHNPLMEEEKTSSVLDLVEEEFGQDVHHNPLMGEEDTSSPTDTSTYRPTTIPTLAPTTSSFPSGAPSSVPSSALMLEARTIEDEQIVLHDSPGRKGHGPDAMGKYGSKHLRPKEKSSEVEGEDVVVEARSVPKNTRSAPLEDNSDGEGVEQRSPKKRGSRAGNGTGENGEVVIEARSVPKDGRSAPLEDNNNGEQMETRTPKGRGSRPGNDTSDIGEILIEARSVPKDGGSAPLMEEGEETNERTPKGRNNPTTRDEDEQARDSQTRHKGGRRKGNWRNRRTRQAGRVKGKTSSKTRRTQTYGSARDLLDVETAKISIPELSVLVNNLSDFEEPQAEVANQEDTPTLMDILKENFPQEELENPLTALAASTISPTKVTTPSPTASPTPSPTAPPTTSPTPSPTASPTPSPTLPPTVTPTESPTPSPIDSYESVSEIVKEEFSPEDIQNPLAVQDSNFEWTNGIEPRAIDGMESETAAEESISEAPTIVRWVNIIGRSGTGGEEEKITTEGQEFTPSPSPAPRGGKANKRKGRFGTPNTETSNIVDEPVVESNTTVVENNGRGSGRRRKSSKVPKGGRRTNVVQQVRRRVKGA